ncbi:hypothetical protein EV421DRAFT_2024116 [Armillaria borealis]|uniref:Uncharacterized protein n=1 Tax=Armillaria borealis TaxID=47425 RepID=A0AA39IZX0_9AGAR|nr:hypothetical protein EV421DRAFT_2024116 [Armillaria borealis]
MVCCPRCYMTETDYCPGKPCDMDGHILPNGTPPPPFLHGPANDYTPYDHHASFELADLLYRHTQISADQLNDLLQIWAATMSAGGDPPFTVDATDIGNVPWQSFTVSYNGEMGVGEPPAWKTAQYEVFFCDPYAMLQNQLGNQDFANEMDFSLKRVTDAEGKHHYKDFMSGNWAWKQADHISDDLGLEDITFVPVIAGSDKMTISMATGQNEYYPVYITNGIIHNNIWHVHRDGVSLLAFLSISKNHEHQDSAEFRAFRRELFHGSLREIFESLHVGMETPQILRYGDGHYRRTIFGPGPYIADYPEQVLLACIVQGWCTASHYNLDGPGGRRTHEHTAACFHAMSSKELWDNYGIIDGIMTANTPPEAAAILADIDCRIAAVPPFPGRGFKQWTGDDSKALMKVYLPAIAGHVPPQMVRVLAVFMEFCYYVRRSVIDEDTLLKIDATVMLFHKEREIFHTVGVHKDEVCSDSTHVDAFSLPQQHALSHYRHLIQEFGAPNGLCSSITESKHIKAVKEPWRRSNHFEALGQMLLINERLDKLAAAWVDFQMWGMLKDSLFSSVNINEEDDGDAVDSPDVLAKVKLARTPVPAAKAPWNLSLLVQRLGLPQLPELIQHFLYEQTTEELDIPLEDVELRHCPQYHGKFTVYPSSVAMYYAPSDLSGLGGLHQEHIHAMSAWRRDGARYNCVFCEADGDSKGFRGLHVACVWLFFSLRHENKYYPCALVTWFSSVSNEPCPETGMWIVWLDLDAAGKCIMSVVHLDSILRGAHLIGVTGKERVPKGLKPSDSLDIYPTFFVNKYVDHHTHEIAF